MQTLENNSDSEVDFDSDDSVLDKNYVPSSSDTESGANYSIDDKYLEYTDTENDINLEEVPVRNFVQDEWHDIDEVTEHNNIIYRRLESATMNFDVNAIKNPADAYQLFLSDDVIRFIVQESNRFARQRLNNQNSSKCRLNLWVVCNENEIKRFFSIVLVMGLNNLPSLNLYWSKDTMFHNEFIANTMTRDRFLLLLRCIHFCNNETADMNDRLAVQNTELIGKYK
ncbi:hypothetical protein NQ314_001866 [Rhamnusium bicolor]|uniref:PiggyBac transposable element-derived protein domain-containing protein n=1 Tax=Rhamnusium bicolor TaxID=1586634 RepID=A0AAV8ZUE3_9CUCU|nr:hypothetical protein NQ314_001866 [Rhamnusium bicolor]